MGFYRTPKPLENPPTPKPPVPFVSEFEKIERRHFEDNPPPLTPSEGKAFSQKIQKSHNPFFLLLRILRRLRFRQDLWAVLDAKYERLHKRVKKQIRYKTNDSDLRTILERYDKKPAIAGNIPYKDLLNSQGDNFLPFRSCTLIRSSSPQSCTVTMLLLPSRKEIKNFSNRFWKPELKLSFKSTTTTILREPNIRN